MILSAWRRFNLDHCQLDQRSLLQYIPVDYTYADSTKIMQQVAQPLIPRVTMTFSHGATPFALHPVDSSSSVSIIQANMNDTETGEISVYLTTDI
jgi:hypothetical protein